MSKASVLETRPVILVDVPKAVRNAVVDCKKTVFSLVREVLSLGRGTGKLTVPEYFYYRLYDDQRVTPESKHRFVGLKRQEFFTWACCERSWVAPAHDKILFYMTMTGAGFDVPPTVAIYHPVRTFRQVPALRDCESLESFLRTAPPPFFGKPCTGMYSEGVISIAGYDRDRDELLMADGMARKVAEVAGAIDNYRRDGYLFQTFIHPHDSIAAICGDRLATVRVVVLLGDTGPKIYRAVWKIPAGNNVADNFWRQGNMLGDVDVESGRVRRVVRGVGADHAEIQNHPTSGLALTGFTLPCWVELKELCLAAAPVFPGLRLQAWDVAITKEGPLLMEVNVGGDFNLPQLARGAGILDEEFCAFLVSCGVKREMLPR